MVGSMGGPVIRAFGPAQASDFVEAEEGRRGTRRGGTPCLVQMGHLHHIEGAGGYQPSLAPKSP